MVQDHELCFPLSFWRTILPVVLICFFALPFSNCEVECFKQPGPFEANTALDHGEQTVDVRSLYKHWVNQSLDESALSAFPILRDGHLEVVNIPEEIWSNHSETFGIKLLGAENIGKVDKIILDHPETANLRILLQWINGTDFKNITCRTLVNVLHKIDFNELAGKIEATCDILNILDVPYKPTKVKEYSQLLSEKYGSDTVIDEKLWLSKQLYGRNITFVDLELKEGGKDVLLADLLSDLQSGTRILFLGRPGVGKTTIARHLSKKLLNVEHFYLVMKVHLGMAGKIDSLSSLIRASLLQASSYEHFDRDEAISNYIDQSLGEGVCFLVDGLDEYDGLGYIASLVAGERLPKSTVIVTSRPSAAERKMYDCEKCRVVEIIGFGEKGMRVYLEQLWLSDADYRIIYSYLETHPNVRQLCYLPLHLSMLVYVAVNNTLSPTDTETKLYSNFLSLTIKQYESVRHKQTVESLQECFEDIYRETDLCVLMQKICEVSFEGIVSGVRRVNSTSFGKLPGSINVSAELEALSLFKVEKTYGGRGNELYVYYYSHPTFQEFLAAFHLTTLPREEQLKYIEYYWMREVYKFFLGLVGSELDKKFDNEIVFKTFVNYAREVLAMYPNKELHIMKCAHEIGQTSQFTTLLQAVGVVNSNSVQVYADHSHDCWYIGYTMTHSPLHEVTIVKHTELALCISFITNYFKHNLGSVNVSKLSLGHYYGSYRSWFAEKEDSISSEEILKFLRAFREDLTHLTLTFVRFEHSASFLQLGEVLKSFKKLQFLAVSVNMSVIKDGCLESALRSLNYLEHLELGVVSKHYDSTPIPGDLLEFKDLNQLKSLTFYIGWNKEIVDVNMTALIGGLMYLTGLQKLSIHVTLYGGFRKDGASELLKGLERVSQPDLALHLDLCWGYGLGNVTTEEVAVVLRNMTTLKNLSLCINFYYSGIQGHGGLIKLSEGLKGLPELHELSLKLIWEMQENEDIDEAAIALVDGLKHLHSLKALELKLQQNGSCSEVSSLFVSLTQLQELKFRWNSPWNSAGGKTDVAKLITELQHLKQLRILDLSLNSLGSDDMVPLIEVLKHLSHLHTLTLSANKIGDTGVQLLAEIIDHHYLTHLQVLRLNGNEFTKAGAEILSQSVVKLSELHTLDFGLDLGRYSAQALIQIQRQKSDLSSSKPSNETCNLVWTTIGEILTLGGFSTGMVMLILSCFFAFKYFLVLPTHKRPLLHEGLNVNLAQSTFSASFAWNLEPLRNQGLNGRGTVIAILDTTINKNDPAFHLKSVEIIDKLPGRPVASFEHGSVCAAVAVGSSYQTSDMTTFPGGVAPDARLIMYRIAEDEYCYDDAVLAALDDMKEKIKNGTQIDVASISYDLKKNNADEIHRKIKALAGNRVTFVAAGGNMGRYQAHAPVPAFFEDCVISVGALDKDGFKSRFNSCGRIDVFAPGENIPTPLSPSKCEGTSFATPAIGGLILLLKQCAKEVGPPASEHIHDVRILRCIFAEHMTIESDSGEEVLDPVQFFQSVIDKPNLLNEIVTKYLDSHTAMEH